MSVTSKALCFALPLFFSFASSAQMLSDELHDITLGDSIQVVQTQLEGHCADIKIIDPEEINFPLAKNSESHLECSGFTTTTNQTIESINFSFADGHLVMIKAVGNACNSLLSSAGDQFGSIEDWDFYKEMHIVANQGTDTVWLLNDDAIHPHLFLWNHQEVNAQDPLDASIPEVLNFGSAYRTLTKKLNALSITTTKEEISPPTIPTNPKRQVQLNCYGFNYAGAPRKLEAVFADGKLAIVWILTAKAEEDRIRQALIRSYGEPIFVSDEIEAFDGWKVALRKDKPEILAISDDLIPFMKSFFGG